MTDEIITDGKGFWCHASEWEKMRKFGKELEKRFAHFLFNPYCRIKHDERKALNEDNRKWAYIIVGKTKMLAWVDNVTMKAYKSDGYDKTWIEYKKFTFDRWCTSFDL